MTEIEFNSLLEYYKKCDKYIMERIHFCMKLTGKKTSCEDIYNYKLSTNHITVRYKHTFQGDTNIYIPIEYFTKPIEELIFAYEKEYDEKTIKEQERFFDNLKAIKNEYLNKGELC